MSSLEIERPPPKIIKHDPLSIYESSLLKLKQGSHCNPEDMPSDSSEEAMTTDADCSSTSSLVNPSSSFQSSGEQTSKTMSILHFFSKCKRSQHADSSNEKIVNRLLNICSFQRGFRSELSYDIYSR